MRKLEQQIAPGGVGVVKGIIIPNGFGLSSEPGRAGDMSSGPLRATVGATVKLSASVGPSAETPGPTLMLNASQVTSFVGQISVFEPSSRNVKPVMVSPGWSGQVGLTVNAEARTGRQATEANSSIAFRSFCNSE
jgi:hypothetical protein